MLQLIVSNRSRPLASRGFLGTARITDVTAVSNRSRPLASRGSRFLAEFFYGTFMFPIDRVP
ncbi:MAG: hypothetical protein ACK400_14595 [Pseudanabaena sp.]